MPAEPAVNPIDGIIERLRQRREADERKLHEEIAATQQSVSQIVSQKEGEVQRAREMARMAAAATGDEIRANRATQAFMQNDSIRAQVCNKCKHDAAEGDRGHEEEQIRVR